MFLMPNKNFSFIEAPIYQGQKHFGVSLGPSYIRQLLLDQHHQFNLLSTLETQSSNTINLSIYEELSYLTEREARRNQLMFIAGGDHSLSIGSIQGLLKCYPELKVLWIDAHGDINTPESSSTQSLHGMPLSMLLGISDHFAKISWFESKLKPENLIYFGLRDLDPAEKVFLEKYKIQNYTTEDIKRLGLPAVLIKIQNDIQGQPLHISLDADAFDPSIAPSTGVPVPNGLCYGEVEKLIEGALAVAHVKSFEYVELNPQIFTDASDVLKTAQTGINLFRLVLEKSNQQEVRHGLDDRFSHSEKPSLPDSHFEMEK